MAKPVKRGLPEDFILDLPDDRPVTIGDFLDEEPLPIPAPKARKTAAPPAADQTPAPFRPEIVPPRQAEEVRVAPRPVGRKAQPSIIRYQLNLSPRAKTMLEELVEYVRTYSPQADARTSEVFQGIVTLLHNAMDELDLAELPRRGAWGSVTAKNFPGELSEAFERSILKSARKRGVQD